MNSIFIAKRFCGPPDSGNGGYTCGLLAESLGWPCAEVTLRKPIPIEREMQVAETSGAAGELKSGDELIATAKRISNVPVNFPPAHVKFDQAVSAAAHSPALGEHPFPTCFVCGPHRHEHDGLRIFPGKVSGASAEIFAAPWIPAAEFANAATAANAKREIRPEFIWAALDCPTGFAAGFASKGKLVTGRMAVERLLPVFAKEACILLSWPVAIDGRKHHAEAALLGPDREVRARAKATWISL